MTCSRLLTMAARANQRRHHCPVMRTSSLLTTVTGRRPARSAAAGKEGTTIRGVVTRSLPSTASSSSSSTSSPTRVLMSPLILHQLQHHHNQQLPNHQLQLQLQLPNHQYQQQQQQQLPNNNHQAAAAAASITANVVEYSTQQQQHQQPSSLSNSTSISGGGGSSTNRTTKATTTIIHRQAHTHAAAHRLVARNNKPPASGWKKPIVSSSSSSSSSLALSSLAQPSSSSSSTTSTSTTTTTDPISLSSSLSSAAAAAAETTTPSSSSSSPGPNTVGVDMEELLKLASNSTTPLSLKEMYKYTIVDVDNLEQRIRNAQFLHNELPVRIAQRAVDLLTLPHGLNEIPAVLQVAHVYLLYLEKFQDCPVPTDAKSEDSFTDMLQGMVLERSSIPNAIARGVDSWMKTEKAIAIAAASGVVESDVHVDDDTIENERMRRIKEMEDALNRFFTARVGVRFLTEHHILSSPARAQDASVVNIKDDININGDSDGEGNGNGNDDNGKNSFLGCIEPNCCPNREVRKVIEAVRKQTMDYYGDGICPEIQIVDGDSAAQQHQHKHKKRQQKKNNFTYVPHHLHYMVAELLKNSCRATVKRHMESGSNTSEKIPPIKIVIVKGAEDITIKIADRGGGIPRSQMSEIWKFAHSTAAKDEVENAMDFGVDEITGASIRGFGLPLARVYARYLGGELTLKSLEGYGLDAYLHLPRLGDDCENLPLPVEFSPGNLSSNPLRNLIE